MAILYSGLETGNHRIAAGLDQGLLTSLTDMAWLGSPELGAIVDGGLVNGTGSDTGRIRLAGLGGADHFASVAEGSESTDTAVGMAIADIAVARGALARNLGDIAQGTGTSGDLDPEKLAADMVAGYRGYYNSLVCTAIAGASTDVGTSGVDASVDDFYDGVYTLEIGGVTGPYFWLGHGRQFADFQESLRAEGGAAQFAPATLEMLKIAGQGIAGEFMGVVFVKSSDVTSSGGNRHGAMFGYGAIGMKRMVPTPAIGAGTSLAVRMDELIVEITRDASKGQTEIAGNAYVGVGIIEDARIVGFVTDA
jgi:hypothetical protein